MLNIHDPIACVLSFLKSILFFLCPSSHSDIHFQKIPLNHPLSYFTLYIFLQVIYQIKLPGPPIIGEGKPENQNNAIIFTRGEALQTIDMNQVRQLILFLSAEPSEL